MRSGPLVLKAHRPSTDQTSLELRLRVAASAVLQPVMLGPAGPPHRVAGRPVTVWPYGEPVTPGDDPPWEEGGRLLARLHAVPVHRLDVAPPSWGGAARVGRAVDRMPADGDGAAAAEVRGAYATLPGWLRDGLPAPGNAADATAAGSGEAPGGLLIHGDWHLGQQVRCADGRWRLIDVDDLGRGDPAWDLARPAALFAAGVLPGEVWSRFVTAYEDAGGPALPTGEDPWTVLDLPARSLAIQMAATCVQLAQEAMRALDPLEQALIDTCSRIRGQNTSR